MNCTKLNTEIVQLYLDINTPIQKIICKEIF